MEPARADFEDACRRLQHCGEALDKSAGVEVFNDERLLYLIAPGSEAARSALAKLREASLFTEAQPAEVAFAHMRQAAPAHSSALAAEYHRVRSSSNRDSDVEAFEAKYGYIRISCVNFDDLRGPSAILRFLPSPRGWLFMVAQGSQILAFPGFTTDLNQERDRLEGIFQYPSAGFVSRVVRPAILELRDNDLVMTAQGLLEAGALLPEPIPDPVPPPQPARPKPQAPKRKGWSRLRIGCLVTMALFFLVFIMVVIKSCS